MEQQLLNRLNVETSRVFSFDVFDTVLTRAVSPPSAVFLIAGHLAISVLPSHCCPAQFAFVREEAERRAYNWYGPAVSLADIYREVQKSLNLSKEQAHQIKRFELYVESEVMYPVPETRVVIQKLRDRGKSVVFTSDMYLSSDQIRGWLIEYHIWQPEDMLVVSCEHSAFKYNGRLFQPIIDQCGSPKKIAHIGNNQKADTNGARLANIRPYYFAKANPNRYEQILEKHARDTGGMSALLAGASRYARLHTEVTSLREEALRDVAAGVMAPVITAFVLWVLQQSEERGLNRLYFGARDGYLLVPIARALTQALSYSVDVRYLYLSRTAISAAYLDPTALRETWDGYEQASGSDLLARLSLEMKDIEPYIPSKEARMEMMAHPITERGKEILREVLIDMQQKASRQPDKVLENRRLFCSYLEQEGLADTIDFAFVDVGWRGNIHAQLNDLLIEEEMITDPIPGLYFGLTADQQAYASDRTAYFFDEYRNIGLGDSWPPGAREVLIEMFCTADHGTVTGYRENGSQVQPTLEPTWSDRVTKWGFPTIQRTVHAYVESVTQHESYINDSDVRTPLSELLRTFWMSPESQEAAAWGGFPREVGQGKEQRVKTLAKPYDARDLLSFARHGHYAHKVLNRYPSWPEASLARSTPWLRRSIRYILGARKKLGSALRTVIKK
jgi:predicted HAD superfamily hydrolase